MKIYEEETITIYKGDCLTELKNIPDETVNCCVTSPPYWGLRDYGVEDQIGLEKTPDEYVKKLVAVFSEVKRVLRDNGTLWLNLGDSYYNYRPGSGQSLVKQTISKTMQDLPQRCGRRANLIDGLKEKDLVGIPWRVAFALQADGWYLRQDIIWHKPNPMPESVTDRCTKSHEYIFLLAKSEKYYYDGDAIKEKATDLRNCYRPFQEQVYDHQGIKRQCFNPKYSNQIYEQRNKRSVWTISVNAYSGAHFATFPTDLIKPMILAGCPVGGTVLDPFLGSGTTAHVSKELNRKCIGIDLNEKYISLAKNRIAQEVLMLQ